VKIKHKLNPGWKPPVAVIDDKYAAEIETTMRRAEKRNALSLEVMRELLRVFSEIGEKTAVRAVILAGEGPAFSAGHDLRELRERDVLVAERSKRSAEAVVVQR